MKKLFIIFMLMLPGVGALAAKCEHGKFCTVDEIMADYQEQLKHQAYAQCSQKVFHDSLEEATQKLMQVKEDLDYVDDYTLQAWTKNVILDAPVLRKVQACLVADGYKEDSTDTVVFIPVKYTFPWGQSVTVSYTTQPKVIKQKIELADKPSLPTNNPNPKLGDLQNDPYAKYINTDPAWYGIMVVQHDSLKDFVGKGKNNLVSLQWINDNVGKIYPKGYFCTSRSAWANDNDTINKVMHNVSGFEDDDNDYYVAGDIDLRWVMWAEVTADVVLTIATLGFSQEIMAGIRSLRIMKNIKNLLKNMNGLKKFKKVQKFAKIEGEANRAVSELARLEQQSTRVKDYAKYRKQAKAARSKGLTREADELLKKSDDVFKEARKVDPNIKKSYFDNPKSFDQELQRYRKYGTKTEKQVTKAVEGTEKQLAKKQAALKEARESGADPKRIAKLEQDIEELNAVQTYMSYSGAVKSMQLAKAEFAFRPFNLGYQLNRPQTGNIFAKTFKNMQGAYKTYKAINGAKTAEQIAKTAKMARAGMGSFPAKAKDWLFHTSLKWGEKLVRFEQNLGLVTEFLYIVGDMYDRTSTTSEKYSNGIKFAPYGLLSADNLEGQENEVNYGMFLMWSGNSTLPQDDDAAYLQVLDFAVKFNEELNAYQDQNGYECNVDIYIVRPIIRLNESNPNKTEGNLFYLFMNDVPWSTAEGFEKAHSNIAAWEAEQENLEESDTRQKNKRWKDAIEARKAAAAAAAQAANTADSEDTSDDDDDDDIFNFTDDDDDTEETSAE